jgi:hypothetical protein
MGTRTIKHHFCDWCQASMPNYTATHSYAAIIDHRHNGPDNWLGEEVCEACDREFRKLRESRQELNTAQENER